MEFLWLLSEIRTPFLEKLMQGLTYLGQEPVLVLIIAICYWCVNKKVAFRMGLSFCTAGLLVQGLKIIFRIPRPWILDPKFKPVKSAVPAATGYSFPSGHTQGATSIYGALVVSVKKKWVKALCVVLFALVGFSRMFLGVHTPKDVLTAMTISIVMVFLVDQLVKPFEEGAQKLPYILIAVILIGSIILLGYAAYQYKLGVIELRYVKDCFKAVGAAIGFIVGLYLEQKYVNFEEKTTLKCQIIKCGIGILVLGVLYLGLKYVAGNSLILSLLRNLIVVIYMTFLYPYIFTKVIKK